MVSKKTRKAQMLRELQVKLLGSGKGESAFYEPKRRKPFVDLAGKEFCGIRPQRCLGKPKGEGGSDWWECICLCGNTVFIRADKIKKRKRVVCNCYVITRNPTSRAYKTWQMMIQRCENPNDCNYRLYGARGIKVCDRWKRFENFLEDMGERPEGPDRMSIDRIDSNGDYEPSNCRWATTKEQARNRRNNIIIEFNGRKMIAGDWAKELGMRADIIRSRLRKGWSAERVLTTPVEYHKSRKKEQSS